MRAFSHRLIWLSIWPLLLTLCMALWATPAHAATINVDGDCIFTDAILSANLDSKIANSQCEEGNGDDLVVLQIGATYPFTQAYTYTIGLLGDLNALPEITSTVIISGNGATVRRAPELNTCKIIHLFEEVPDQFRLFKVGTDGNLTLQNLTVENGCAVSGGGIQNGGTLTVIDSSIRGNTGMANDDTEGGGGGLFNDGGTMTLLHSQILSNTDLSGEVTYFASCGGGVTNLFGTLNLINSTIVANQVVHVGVDDLTGDGGGICNLSGSLYITGSQILSNTAGINGVGGGIASYFVNDEPAFVHISDSAILSNTAKESGGGISNVGATLTIQHSRFVANHSESDGGGLSISYSSTVTLVDTELVTNSAGQRGGGIFSRESTVTITRVSLIGNTAGQNGGALYQALPRKSNNETTYGPGSAQLTQSRVLNNSSVALYSEGETVDAVDNWWGDADGPSGEGDGDGDSISKHVLFEPYKTEDFLITGPLHQLLPNILKK